MDVADVAVVVVDAVVAAVLAGIVDGAVDAVGMSVAHDALAVNVVTGVVDELDLFDGRSK